MYRPTAAAIVVTSLAALFAAPSHAADQPAPPPRMITVTGTGEVRVAPDEVVLSIGVEAMDKDVEVALADHDVRIKRVFEVARRAGVDERGLQSDHISIQPKSEPRPESRWEFVGYEVTQTVNITLRDLTKYQALLTDLLKAGVNRVNGVSFRVREPRAHQDEARRLALHAAREKAVAMAAELGEKVGRAQSINEGSGGYWASSTNSLVLAVGAGRAGAESSDNVAPGQVVISAEVTVSFNLE